MGLQNIYDIFGKFFKGIGEKKIRNYLIAYFLFSLVFWAYIILLKDGLRNRTFPLSIASPIAFTFGWTFAWFLFSILVSIIFSAFLNGIYGRGNALRPILVRSILVSVVFLVVGLFTILQIKKVNPNVRFNEIVLFNEAYFILHAVFLLMSWIVSKIINLSASLRSTK